MSSYPRRQLMKKGVIIVLIVCVLTILGFLLMRSKPSDSTITRIHSRIFTTSFESLEDFYVAPQDDKGTSHELWNGYAKVWQDRQLVSHAQVQGANGLLAQAHFGLYAAPSISNLTVYNDDLTIREIDTK